MNTERKKRIPKPPPNEATRFLLEVALPFLELPFDRLSSAVPWPERLEDAADAILPSVATIIWDLGGRNFKPEDTLMNLENCGWRDSRVLQHLLCTISGCRSMISAATKKSGGGSCVTFPHCYYETISPWKEPVRDIDLHSWIRDALETVRPWAVWVGLGHTYVEWMAPGRHPQTLGTGADMINSWKAGVRAELVRKIAESFHAKKIGEPPNGAYYLGVCSHCGKVMLRDRTTKTTCSDACRKAKARIEARSPCKT